MHPHTSSFSYRIAAAAARLGVLLTPRGLDDVLTASAVCFLALGFWLPIRHALIERHYFPSPPHFFSAVASSFSHTLATVPHRAGLPSFSLTRASSRRTSLQLLVAQAMRITVSLIAPRSYHETGGFEPQTAAWSSSRWRELRASPTDSRHISYVQSHSIELNRSDLDFWPAHCGVTSHLWLHDSEQHAPGATWCVPLRRYTHPPHARMRLTGGKTECLTRTAFLSPRRADAASDRTTLTALSAIVALASSLED